MAAATADLNPLKSFDPTAMHPHKRNLGRQKIPWRYGLQGYNLSEMERKRCQTYNNRVFKNKNSPSKEIDYIYFKISPPVLLTENNFILTFSNHEYASSAI